SLGRRSPGPQLPDTIRSRILWMASSVTLGPRRLALASTMARILADVTGLAKRSDVPGRRSQILARAQHPEVDKHRSFEVYCASSGGEALATRILRAVSRDVRFPTSLTLAGSDAMNRDPDYSAAYVVLETDHPAGLAGHGLTFTIGRGTELCVAALDLLAGQAVGRPVAGIAADLAGV